MPALGDLHEPRAVQAMNAINVRAVTPVFMTQLFGTAAAALALGAWAVLDGDVGPAAELVAGSALYLVGTIFVAIVGNVPLNDGLAAGTVSWERYLRRWTALNHLRALASLAACAALIAALAGRPPAKAGRRAGLARPEP